MLGRGAMGVVYRAHDPVIDRTVAIKLVLAELLDGDDRASYVARFQREAQAAGRCAHPNIVGVFDFAMHGANPYLAMEYVDGVPLSQVPRGPAPAPVGEAVDVAAQVLDGLAAAHALGVIHRDIKPANILLPRRGRVKVADFGISRLDASAMTGTGTVVGTPGYMSPEQCRGEAADARSDLFSTGAVLYELVTGQRPFPGRQPHEVWHKLLHEEPPDPAALRPDAPAALHAALRRSLAKAPADRFPSAAAMAGALRDALGNLAERDEDRTVLATRPSPAASARESAPELAPPTLGSSVVGTLERELARHVGPIAGRMVRSAAGRASTVEELCALLASNLDAGTRQRFTDGVQASLREAAQAGTARQGAAQPGTLQPFTATPAGTTLSDADLEQARQDLARHVGPIARVLVKRAAAGCATADDLRERLAAHLEGAADRQAFLRKPPAAGTHPA